MTRCSHLVELGLDDSEGVNYRTQTLLEAENRPLVFSKDSFTTNCDATKSGATSAVASKSAKQSHIAQILRLEERALSQESNYVLFQDIRQVDN